MTGAELVRHVNPLGEVFTSGRVLSLRTFSFLIFFFFFIRSSLGRQSFARSTIFVQCLTHTSHLCPLRLHLFPVEDLFSVFTLVHTTPVPALSLNVVPTIGPADSILIDLVHYLLYKFIDLYVQLKSSLWTRPLSDFVGVRLSQFRSLRLL